MTRRAFSLVELILAIFILGIGMISIAALFPAGIKQQEIAEDDVYGPLVARHAMELLRTRLKQDDFGSFEEFSSNAGFTQVTVRDPVPLNAPESQYVGGTAIAPTIPNDWIWKRPGLVTVDDTNTADRDEAGMYDIFSYYKTRRNAGGTRLTLPSAIPTAFTAANLLSDVGTTTTAPRDRLSGIPYNRSKYDQVLDVTKVNYAWTFAQSGIPASGAAPSGNSNLGNAPKEPAVFITQRERYWPMPANAVGPTPTPRYVWDCMFRRFNGRILVGVFVYRVIPANGLRGGNNALGTPYVAAKVTTTMDAKLPTTVGIYPPLPQWVTSRTNTTSLSRAAGDGANTPWGAGGINGKVGSTLNASKYSPNRDDCGVPGTGPSTSTTPPTDPTPLAFTETWQMPGQWLIDQYNNVHHVIEGRRTHDDGPVILAKPVPRQPYSNSLFDATTAALRLVQTNLNKTAVAGADSLLATPGSGGDEPNGIQDLWFIPSYDANGNQLVPVYACVEEL
jgi:hypothetical protein